MKSRGRRARPVLWVPVFLLGVPLLGVAVPVGWLWIASQLQSGSNGGIELLPAAALVLGLPGTYVALTAVASRLDRRTGARSRPRHRDAWTRSLSAERHAAPRSTPIEAVFVTTVVVVGVFSEVYLLFFASPNVALGP
jgi:hypothetical protein